MAKKHKQVVLPAVRAGERIPSPAGAPVARSTIHDKVVFSFEHYEKGYECISAWNADEAKALFEMFRKASQMTWMQVFSTGGRSGNKTGLGWTDFGKNDPFTRPVNLSADFTIAEMRATGVARVFGYKKDATFYVIRLDRTHSVCSE